MSASYLSPESPNTARDGNFKKVWWAGEGRRQSLPLSLLREALGNNALENVDNGFLPKLVAEIEANNGVATLHEPEVDPKLPILWAVIGASGVGKSSLLNQLTETCPQVHILQTASSRGARSTEPQKPYLDLPVPKPGEERHVYEARVKIENYDLLDETWYGGNIYGLPRAELARVSADQIPVVGTAAGSLWQLKANLKGQYNVVSIGIVPRTYVDLIGVIEAERGDPDEQSYRAARVHHDTAAIGREANFAILNPYDPDPNTKADSIKRAAETTARLILDFQANVQASTNSTIG